VLRLATAWGNKALAQKPSEKQPSGGVSDRQHAARSMPASFGSTSTAQRSTVKRLALIPNESERL